MLPINAAWLQVPPQCARPAANQSPVPPACDLGAISGAILKNIITAVIYPFFCGTSVEENGAKALHPRQKGKRTSNRQTRT